MKKKLLIAFIIILLNINVSSSNEVGITQDNYIKLCGVWELCKDCGVDSAFSWGKGKFVYHHSIVMDLGEEEPFFFAGPMGESNITKIYVSYNKYIIRILFRDKNQYNLEVIFNKDGTIFFNKMEWFKKIPLLRDEYGEKYIYNKISGPTIKYYKPKTSNLRLRSDPSLKENIIRLLNKDEKLLLIKKGHEETIDGIKGTWIKVLSEKGEMGWCFDGFLEAL